MLLEMLGKVRELTLEFLNQATQAWVEIEYNRRVHREIGGAPAKRFAAAPDVLRPSPSSDALRAAFRRDVKRRQRQSDGTISLEGVRFEIPNRYRHFRDVVVRYPRWDLSLVDLVDPREGTVLAHGLAREAEQLDEKLYLELYRANRPPASSKKKVRV